MYLALLGANNLNLRFVDEPSPEFNIDPSTHIEADLPKKSRCLQLWLTLETYTTTN